MGGEEGRGSGVRLEGGMRPWEACGGGGGVIGLAGGEWVSGKWEGRLVFI